MARHAVLKSEKQAAHINWAAWNAWASEQDWYINWAADNGFKASDLKSKRRNPQAKIIYDETEGAALYQLRHLLEHELEMLRLERSKILERLWKHETEGKWTYSLVQIADAYGYPPGAVNKMMSGQPWFIPRLEMSGHRWREAI